jgi:UDP-2,3-diacylglucosamine pyrophosphatase LpxH
MKVQSLFISDIHLGYPHCKTDKFLAFIEEVECENLFVVGDLIDACAFHEGYLWKNDNNAIVEKILRFTRGTGKIYYIWGNHDDFLCKWKKFALGKNIEINRRKIYKALNGKKYLLIHGDQFDGFIRLKFFSILQKLSNLLYDGALEINRIVNKLIRKLGWREKYMSIFLNPKLNNFQALTTQEAKRYKCEGVICGHIHHPKHYKNINNIEYFNCGDWISSCSYIVENLDGTFNVKKFYWENKKKV